ncbi:hypothetical protein MRB53_036557 [Persea americana]|nr:hypothetical protein MRB53_037470 [Persea americana]KAJ8614691.1 hypothetical protein MRB53_036557 [Persea americana]
MLRSLVYSVASPLFSKIKDVTGTMSLSLTIRFRGGSYRVCGAPHRPKSRRWLRHFLCMHAPSGVFPLPVALWLAFPDLGILTPEQLVNDDVSLEEILSPPVVPATTYSHRSIPEEACEFEEDKEKEDEVDFNFTLAPPRSSGECFARSHLLEKEGDFGSIVASNGAVGGEEVNSRRGMDTTPLIEPDRA